MEKSEELQKLLPVEFLSRMASLLGEEYPAFLESISRKPGSGLRVNTHKLSPNDFAAISPFPLSALPGLPEGFLVAPDAQPGRHPYHAAGLYYLQDPSAMLATHLLDPQPGEKVLDLSAAPGGKTTHIAARMGRTGLIVANEIDTRRAWELAENLERLGIRNAVILNENPGRLAKQFEGYFDRVLFDAPCSGEGMFGKSQAARQQWSPALVESCALRQGIVIEQAAAMVRLGGILGYVTCTFEPEENERIVDRFLQKHPDFEVHSPSWMGGYGNGHPEWVQAKAPNLEYTVRVWPHNWPGGGQYIAILRKRGETSTGSPAGLHTIPRLAAETGKLYQAFQDETLLQTIDSRLLQAGSYLYQIQPDLPDLHGLKVLHPGWWLGTIKKGRFEPSHTLAMGLETEEARHVIQVNSTRPEAADFLRGETLRQTGANGWVLVAVDGFPLGWGKRVGDQVKNHYPRGLRTY